MIITKIINQKILHFFRVQMFTYFLKLETHRKENIESFIFGV